MRRIPAQPAPSYTMSHNWKSLLPLQHSSSTCTQRPSLSIQALFFDLGFFRFFSFFLFFPWHDFANGILGLKLFQELFE